VGLEELPLRALVAVLGLREVRQLGIGAARPEERQLLGAEGEPPADQLGPVGVQDPPVPRPQLHADDRVAEHLAVDEVVEERQLVGLGREDAVAEPRGLHEAPLEADERAGVALGLPDGHRPQREEAADQHDGDGHQAPEQEAADGGGGGRSGLHGADETKVQLFERRRWPTVCVCPI
jgi:hypothetical protein